MCFTPKKRFKKLAKKFAAETLIPLLQEKVDAGAVDPHVDKVIKEVVNEAIDKI